VDGKKLAYVYGSTYLFYNQYLNVRAIMGYVCGLGLLGITASVMFFTLSVRMTFIIVITIIFTAFQSYGGLAIIGAKLNAFSAVNLGISVGMSVEFTAHFARAYSQEPGDDPNVRMQKAFEATGAPLFGGAMSTFLAVVWLSMARFEFINIYFFKMFSLTNMLAYLNGVIFLPVLCSLMGGEPVDVMKGYDDDDKKDKDTGEVMDISVPSPTLSGEGTAIPMKEMATDPDICGEVAVAQAAVAAAADDRGSALQIPPLPSSETDGPDPAGAETASAAEAASASPNETKTSRVDI